MATKTATIVINVDDKSLVELNAEIKALETSISGLKVGTQQWVEQNQKLGILKTRFQETTREATKLQSVVEKIGGAEQIRAVAKLGAGLVGGFTAASGAVRLFGIESEVFDEMTARATTLMSIMGGLNQVSELFGKETIKGLGAIGVGFKGLVTTVKTASLGIKAALITTGIGALIVGVGLLVANFDKIKNLFSGAAREQKKLAEEQVRYTETSLANANKDVKLRENELAISRLNGQLTDNRLDVAQKEYNLAIARNDANKEAITNQQAIIDQKILEINVAKDKDIAEINQQIKKAEFIEEELKSQTDLLRAEELRAGLNLEIAKSVEGISDEIKKQQDLQIVLTAEADKQRAIYQVQYNILSKQIEESRIRLSKLNKAYQKTEQENLDSLIAQRKALTIQEETRRKLLKTEIEQIESQRKFENGLIRIANAYRELENDINTQYDALNQNNVELDISVNHVDKITKQYEVLRAKREALANFDKKGRELNEKQTKDLREQLSIYDGIIKDSLGILQSNLQGVKFDVKKVELAAEELALYRLQQQAKKDILENDLALLRNRQELLTLNIKELTATGIANQYESKRLSILLGEAKIKLANAKNDEERKTALDEVVALESQINSLNQNTADLKQQIIDKDNELLGVENEIVKTNVEIVKTTEDTVEKTKELTDELEKQSTITEKLQSGIGKYGEEIQAAREAISNTIEFIAALQDRKAEEAQRRIDEYQDQLDDLQDQEDDRQDKLVDYEEELKDANGERFDELMSMIDAEKQASIVAKDEINLKQKQIDEEDRKRREAEYKAAKWRKAQGIIDATIAGALAVIKSLPNVFLAVASGVAAAAGIATIAAQKTPDIPKGYQVGGFTTKSVSDKQIAGVVHANEFVVSAPVTRSASARPHIEALNRMNLRGFESGGFVPPVNNNSNSDFIDYDRMANAFLGAVQMLPNPIVSVQKITDEQSSVKVTKSLAGVSR